MSLPAQSDIITLVSIDIQGNKQTREPIILRELPFKAGDTVSLSRLPALLKEGRQQLMNTGLFQAVDITYANWEGSSNSVYLLLAVEENWYIYPVPVFELADRNFNVWWTEQDRSLDRINYGLEFTHQNFSGWNDALEFGAEFGYTRQYALGYERPYLNRAGTIGLAADLSFRQNREVNYITTGNKQIFYNDPDDFIYQRFGTRLGLTFRPRLYARHEWTLGFQRNTVADIIARQNRNFFGEGRSEQRYFHLSYRFTLDRRDIRPYPWRGHYFSAEIEKDGLGVFPDRNALTLEANFRRYTPIGKRMSLGWVVSGKASLIRSAQPYTDNRAIGFGSNSLNGYEFYIIDGLDLFIAKTSLRYRLFSENIYFGKLMPISAFRAMPIKTYIGLSADTGIANDPYTAQQNGLANQWLFGQGISFDVVLYYDKVIRVQYNRNHLGEGGLFFKLDLNI